MKKPKVKVESQRLNPSRTLESQEGSISGQLRRTMTDTRPVAYRRIDIKPNGEFHLKEFGVAPIRWAVILIGLFLAVLRLKDPSLIISALAKLAHLP